jgi:exonuclease SbcD
VSPLKELRRSTSSKFHIGMAHGSLHIPEKVAEDDHVFRLEEVNATGMDYLALGHWHRVYKCPAESPAWYPGPPEWIPGQTEKGVVLMVSLLVAGEVEVQTRELGLRDYKEVEIDMNGIQDLAVLKSRISGVADQNLIAKVTLRGLRDVEFILNTEDLETELGESFFHLRVIDTSHPKSAEITEGEERLIASRFARLMKGQIEGLEGEEKEIAENALQYGMALLDGKEVL